MEVQHTLAPQLLKEAAPLNEILARQAELLPADMGYQFVDEANNTAFISYQDLVIKAKKIASYLLTVTQPGDRILLIYPPGLDYITAFFGVIFSGRIAVPVYPPFKSEFIYSLQNIIANCSPKAVLSNQRIIKEIQKLKTLKAVRSFPMLERLIDRYSGVEQEFLQWDFNKLHWINTDAIQSHPISNKLHDINVNDLAFLQYTSGSTGNPKGVCVSHSNIFYNQKLINSTMYCHSDTTIVSWLPPYHDMGLIGAVLHPCYVGCNAIFMSPTHFIKSPLSWLQLISENKHCVSGGPNFAYELCLNRVTKAEMRGLDLSSWDMAFCGSEPIQPTVINQFIDYFSSCKFNKNAFYACYGLAEGTLYVSGRYGLKTLPHHKLDSENPIYNHTNKHYTSCGVPSQHLKIVDTVSKQPLSGGEVGEIAIAGRSVTSGYWDDGKALETFIQIDNTPYLLTGDLGVLIDGELYVTGRMKETIIIAGKNYYPQDIEFMMTSQLETIKKGACVVFGIENSGISKIVVMCELAGHHTAYEDIAKTIEAVLFKEYQLIPHRIVFLPPKKMAKTTSGKLKRLHMKQAFLDDTLQAVYQYQKSRHQVTHDENEHPLLIVIKDILSLPETEAVDVSKSLDELGIDSLGYSELQSRLEDDYPELYARIDFKALSMVKSIQEAIEIIESNKN